MKKIININLSGLIIPIEDSAFENLKDYIESLRRYFAHEESRDEIINDIEIRIAELLNEKIRKGAAAITDADIAEVTASMGTVADFEAQDHDNVSSGQHSQSQTTSNNTGSSQYQEQSNYQRTSRGRLYRDSNDRFIGGVCSGIAAYLNVDPAVVRLLFGIFAFGTGIGFLAYIIMWIVLPPRDLEGYRGKRLYRNPDDAMLGGVAGGLGAYFNRSPRTIRLIFAAPILLNILIGSINHFTWDSNFDIAMNIGFGSLSGTFILAYIVLWIVLPEANSDFEKMEMRGEKVDINRIRENVKAGMSTFRDRMKDWSSEVRESAENLGNRAKDFTSSRVGGNDIPRRRNNSLGHVLGVIIKSFMIFIGGVIAVAVFVTLIALLFGGVAWWPINNFLWTSKWQQGLAWATFILFLVVPMVALIVWIIRRVIRARSRSNYLGWTFGGLWTLGWVAMILFVSNISRDFRTFETVETSEVSINQPANSRMIVAVSQPELEFSGGFGWMNDGGDGWDLTDDTLKIAGARIVVNRSDDDKYHVYLNKSSWGKSGADARNRAEAIRFDIQSKDSILDLGNSYAIAKEQKFRGQHIEIIIRVPLGKSIRFDQSVQEKLDEMHIKVRRSRRSGPVDIEINDHSEFFRYRSDVNYLMTESGLVDPNDTIRTGNGTATDTSYRYPGNNPAPQPAKPAVPVDTNKQKTKIPASKNASADLHKTNFEAGMIGLFNS